MAYDPNNLSALTYANGFTLWHYKTPDSTTTVDTSGYFNEAAGMLLGKPWEELGTVGAREWGALFGPFDDGGEPIPYDELPLVKAVRDDRPAHAEFEIRSTDGAGHRVEVSAFPIQTPHGSRGAIAVFWPAADDGANGASA